MGLGSFLFGDEGGMEQHTTRSPEQMQALQSVLGGISGPRGDMMNVLGQWLSQDPQAMKAFEAPTMRQFQQQIMPQIAERYAGLGTGGALGSSAFMQSQAQAGRELGENLAAMRANLQQQAMARLMGLEQLGQTQTFENVYRQPQQGFLQGALGSALGGLASGGLMSLMGGLGGGSLPGLFTGMQNAPGLNELAGVNAIKGGGSAQTMLNNYLGMTNRGV